MATATKPATREILVVLQGGVRRKVSGIPANAKITYGPVSPGSRDYNGGANALRIYTTTNNQLAVFVNVVEFRDLSLTVLEQKVEKKAKSESENGPKGAKRAEESETIITWETA